MELLTSVILAPFSASKMNQYLADNWKQTQVYYIYGRGKYLFWTLECRTQQALRKKKVSVQLQYQLDPKFHSINQSRDGVCHESAKFVSYYCLLIAITMIETGLTHECCQ